MTLSDFWEEKTIIRFVLDVDGEITESYFIHKPLVEEIIGRKQETLMGIWEQRGLDAAPEELAIPQPPTNNPHRNEE